MIEFLCEVFSLFLQMLQSHPRRRTAMTLQKWSTMTLTLRIRTNAGIWITGPHLSSSTSTRSSSSAESYSTLDNSTLVSLFPSSCQHFQVHVRMQEAGSLHCLEFYILGERAISCDLSSPHFHPPPIPQSPLLSSSSDANLLIVKPAPTKANALPIVREQFPRR